jgi:hypothetical protein
MTRRIVEPIVGLMAPREISWQPIPPLGDASGATAPEREVERFAILIDFVRSSWRPEARSD